MFEDYAIAHWLDHVDSSTSRLLPSEATSFGHLAQKLELFLGKHWSDSPPDPLVPLEPKFQSIRQWDFTKKLDTLAQLAHQRKSNEMFLDLEEQAQRRRFIYEDILTNSDPHNEALRERLLLNASGWFKCPKRHCDSFFEGFANKEDRDKHIDQHERPFRCSFEECLYAKLGYGREKDLKRHEKKSHSTGEGSEGTFPTYKPKKQLDMFSASREGDLATVQRLVEEGVDLNLTTTPNTSTTALSLAVKNDHADVVKYLIAKECRDYGDLNITTAIRHANTSIMQMLLEMEHPKRRIERAQYALREAVFCNWVDAIPLLLSYGIDINHKYIQGITPLQYARMQEHHAFVQALLEHGALDDSPPPTPTPATPVTPGPGASASPSVHNLLNINIA